jgi:hypothetical protein
MKTNKIKETFKEHKKNCGCCESVIFQPTKEFCDNCRKEERLDFLGKGIVIGLMYAFGVFFMTFFKDSKLGLMGIPFFILAPLYHHICLKEIKQ